MRSSLIWCVLYAIGGLIVNTRVEGQVTSPEVLLGVDSVDAQVDLTWDRRLAQPDEEVTRSRLRTVFELELRKHDIIVSSGAKNFLSLELVLLYNDAGTVSYAYGVRLREPGIPARVITSLVVAAALESDSSMWQRAVGPDSLKVGETIRAGMWDRFMEGLFARSVTWVTTWEGPTGVVHVGRLKLQESLERQAVEAAQAFVNAYMANRRR